MPKIVDLENWTVTPWEIQPAGDPERGHHDDAIAELTGVGPLDGLKTRVIITSFDFEGRNDEQLTKWALRKVQEEIATAVRRAA